MTRVTVTDLRAARYCFRGVRPWFDRHGLSWSDFVTQGLEAEVLLATGDALVGPVIRAAEERESREAGNGGRR